MPLVLRRLLLTAVLLCGAAEAIGATEGAPELVSWDHTNSTGVGSCQNTKISADGRFVAFDCDENKHLLLPPDERHRLKWLRATFVRDRLLRKTWLVDYSRHQDAALDAPKEGDFDFSQDGRWVVFSTKATNVVPGDTNNVSDVFVWDRIHDTVARVSRSFEGKQGDGNSSNATFAKRSTGALAWPPVVFLSAARNLVRLPGEWRGFNVFVSYQSEYGAWRTRSIVSYPDRCYPDVCHLSAGGGTSRPQMMDGRVCFGGTIPFVLGADPISEHRLYCQVPAQPFNPQGVTSVLSGFNVERNEMIGSATFLVEHTEISDQTFWYYAGEKGEPLIPFTSAPTNPPLSDGETVVWGTTRSSAGEPRGVYAQKVSDIRSSGDCLECRRRVSDGNEPSITLDGEAIAFYWSFATSTEPPPAPGVWGDVYVIGRPLVNEPFRLRLIDPARKSFAGTPLLDESSASYVTADLAAVAAANAAPVKGMAADGVTRTIVYAALPGPGDLQLALYEQGWEGAADWPRPGLSALTASAPQDVTTIDGSGFEWQTLSVPAQLLADGTWAAAALVWAPASFGSEPSLVQARSRRTHLFGTFTSSADGSLSEARTELEVVRPPVFLVHGLWSGPETWEYGFVESQEARLFGLGNEHRARYPNDEPYRRNVPRIATQLSELRRVMQDEGYAVTQAWGVGHSMGGQLLRRMVGAPICVLGNCSPTRLRDRLDNFHAGDLYGLVSVNSPHFGSPLADRLLPFAIESPVISSMLCRAGFCPLRGAVDDLRVASAETRGMPPLSLPTAVLVGAGGSQWVANWSPPVLSRAPRPARLLSLVLLALSRDLTQDMSVELDKILGVPHDVAVGFDSQRGGASTFSVFPYVDETATGMHTDATVETRVSDQVLNLLLGLEPGSFVDGLVAGVGHGESGRLAAEGLAIEADASLERRRMIAANEFDRDGDQGDPSPDADGPGSPGLGLRISMPTAGAVFAPGDSIVVRATAGRNFTASRGLIALGDQALLRTDGRLVASFVAPEYAGPLAVTVVAYDEGRLEYSAQVEVVIEPLAPVVRLIPADRELLVIEGDRLDLRFSAEYADGLVREVSTLLVTLGTDDPSVAQVEDGQVIAIAPGRTLIRAVLAGSPEALLPVEVTRCPEVRSPDVFASGSTELCPGASVTLTSSLADAYSWSTGEITRSISVSEPGEYTVTATQIGNCKATSQPVVISAAGPTAGCEEGPPPPPETVVAEDFGTTVFKDASGILGFTAGAPDGVALIYSLVEGTGPVNGTLGALAPGPESPSRTAHASYTPHAGFLGSDSFEFQVCGTIDADVVCDRAVYSIEVVEPPVEEGDLAPDRQVTAVTEVPLEVDLLPGASEGLSVTLTGLPQFGTLLDGSGQAVTSAPASLTGSQVSYVSDPGFVGSDSFSYEVSDGSTADAGVVTVVVEAETCDNSPSLCDDDGR